MLLGRLASPTAHRAKPCDAVEATCHNSSAEVAMEEILQPHVEVEMGVRRVRSDISLGDEERLALMMTYKAGMIRSQLQRMLVLLSLSVIAGLVGVLVAGLIMLETIKKRRGGNYDQVQIGGHSSHGLAVAMLLLMSVVALAWGVAVWSPAVAIRVRGSLEYTSLMVMNLKRGQRYKYAKLPVKAGIAEDSMQRELHQLKFEAGLTGWNAKMLKDQSSKVEAAYSSHELSFALKAEARKIIWMSRSHALKSEARKIIWMVKHTVVAMPALMAGLGIVVAVVVCGAGALGFSLSIGLFQMPNTDDDQLVIECCWQTLNFVFTVVAIFKGPGRIRVCYHLWRHDYEEVIDGIPRSLMIPGVLMARREVVTIATLRLVNFLAQYVINYFMWAWLPQCYGEVQERKAQCASRVPIVVPIFVVVGACSDIASNILLHKYIVNCDYLLWPTLSSSGDVLTAASCEVAAGTEELPKEDLGEMQVHV